MKIDHLQSRFLLLICIAFLNFSCSKDESTLGETGNGTTDVVTPPDDTSGDESMDIAGVIRDISSMDLVAEMGVGWNLGNSLDVESVDKTDWGNPLPSQAIIDKVYEIGFRTLRVPVTWSYHQVASAPYTIDADYLNLVQETLIMVLARVCM